MRFRQSLLFSSSIKETMEDSTLRLLRKTFRFEAEDDFKFFSHLLKLYTSHKASFYHVSLEKLALLSLVKEVYTRSPYLKMIKLLTFDRWSLFISLVVS